MSEISAREHPKKQVVVNGKNMAYVELGDGAPVVFCMAIPHRLIFGGTSCPMCLVRTGRSRRI